MIKCENPVIPLGHFLCYLCEEVYPNEFYGIGYTDGLIMCELCQEKD